MKVFDKYWFKRNQYIILKALNAPILGGMVRRGLWIEDKLPIIKITPDSVHIRQKDGKIKAIIYSNNQFAEAMHMNFKPIWEALHMWDMKFANRLSLALNVGFDTYSSQPDETNGVDATINSALPSTNNDSEIRIGESGAVCRAFVKFDLSSIPSSAALSSATHSLWYWSDYATNNRTYKMYRCKRNWVENQVTWNNYSSGNAWSTAGCGDTTNDYDSTVHATANMSATATPGTELQWAFDATGLAELKKMIDGTYSNYGWLHKADTESADMWYFYASAHTTPGERPKLVIVYSVSSSAFFSFF